MLNQIFTCDVCGKQKGTVNHWWMYDDSDSGCTSIEIMPWISAEADRFKHACGQDCITQAVNKWMQEQSK